MVILFSSKRTLTALISEELIPCSFNSLSVRFCHFHSFAQHLSVEPVVICQPNWIEPKFCINAILNDMNMDRLTWISFVLNKAKIGNLYIGIEPALILNGLKDCIHHIIHGQAKVLEKRLSRRRFSKCIDADNAAFKPDVFAPEIADARFDCNPLDAARQYMLPPLRILPVKYRCRRHRYDARRDAAQGQRFNRGQRKPNFRSGRNQNGSSYACLWRWLYIPIAQNITALLNLRDLRRVARDKRDFLSAQRQATRRMARDRLSPCNRCFNAIRWPPDIEMRNQPQRGQMFNRLMRWPVFA